MQKLDLNNLSDFPGNFNQKFYQLNFEILKINICCWEQL